MATSSNLLSPEELAALAQGIDDGTIAIDTGFNLTTRVKKHDLASEDSTLGVNTPTITTSRMARNRAATRLSRLVQSAAAIGSMIAAGPRRIAVLQPKVSPSSKSPCPVSSAKTSKHNTLARSQDF